MKKTSPTIAAPANTVHLSQKWCHSLSFTKKSFQVATSSSPPQSLHPKPREARLFQQTSKDLQFRSTMGTAWPPQKGNCDLEQVQHGGWGLRAVWALPTSHLPSTAPHAALGSHQNSKSTSANRPFSLHSPSLPSCWLFPAGTQHPHPSTPSGQP